MKHAARRPLAWLIFDVRQKMKLSHASDGNEVLRVLMKQIEASVACSSQMTLREVTAERFTVEVGRDANAVITVSVVDETVPSFGVSYPVAKSRNGSDEVVECTATDVRAEGVVWIVRKVFRFGFVPPEGYRKRQVNRGRPNKAPEPTPVAVMPRAISRVTEMNPQNQKRSEARVTPATGVAHL